MRKITSIVEKKEGAGVAQEGAGSFSKPDLGGISHKSERLISDKTMDNINEFLKSAYPSKRPFLERCFVNNLCKIENGKVTKITPIEFTTYITHPNGH